MNTPRPRLPTGLTGLSARLIVLTIGFVMLAEVLIYAPSIARFRLNWLEERVGAAHLATLALEATPDNMVSESLKTQLLDHAGVLAVVIAKPGDVRRILAPAMPPMADAGYDLRAASFMTLIFDALSVVTSEPSRRVVRIVDTSPKDRSVVVEVLLHESELCGAMRDFGYRILALSLIISFLTATLVYLSLQWLIVRPLRRLTANMVSFREAPENPATIVGTTERRDELGVAQRELAHMETTLRSALKQRERLAALGAAVAKINHDLRNILSAARLMSDRLSRSSDPHVQKAAPTLLASIDRAVSLCEHTLGYAREEHPPPHRTRFPLAALAAEVGEVVSLLTAGRAVWDADIPGEFDLVADREQLFRVLVNLGRNAAEAGARHINVLAAMLEEGVTTINIVDDGPGLPKRAQERLFEPFTGSAKSGGTGLGLAIARELVRAHGGELRLIETGSSGTTFRIELPPAGLRRAAAE
jgi:signal transduction histidine kinase